MASRNDASTENLPDDAWLIRPCEAYREKYKDCKSTLSRVYQYYIYGNMTDCTQWMTSFTNCMKFRNTRDPEAAAALIEVERQRRKLRLQHAKDNNVWEYRTSPPPGWYAPLPGTSS